jgi:hypothetical protein
MEIENSYFWYNEKGKKNYPINFYEDGVNEYIGLIYSDKIDEAVNKMRVLVRYCYYHDLNKEQILYDMNKLTLKNEIIYFTKGILSVI